MTDNYFPIEFGSTGDGFTIINSGTAPAPCIITYIPKIDVMNLVITGLTEEPITMTKIYKDTVLVIDGEKREVLINDAPALNRYNAWEFPKLQPGANQITITYGAQASIAIEYSARYI